MIHIFVFSSKVLSIPIQVIKLPLKKISEIFKLHKLKREYIYIMYACACTCVYCEMYDCCTTLKIISSKW